ncbi:prepilin-type N-terminal cleavage/methylation domain-containing protein [Helicobacter brantae]|uniref:Uncharacterized protein n=1 Tax=Helicobacter brantae TaxID=375927 RepID=A0A3D8J303_9HELI|nr:prepilin-type N-terminal cleavage/methylation domain-containing protein [Helicobacter brantae]RDU71783.1 hypothetical protein CQA58_01710 [Helicobacter brantae]
MRRGFALLEVLLALLIFCVLILGCSKIMLELTRSKIAYSKFQLRQIEVQNAVLMIEQYLRFSPSLSFGSQSISFYPLNLSYFLSPTFSPLPTQCKEDKISFAYPSPFVYSRLDKRVLRVLEYREGEMKLEQSVACGLFFPLLPQITLSLNPQRELRLNGQILLKEVEDFEILENAGGVRLCGVEIVREEWE